MNRRFWVGCLCIIFLLMHVDNLFAQESITAPSKRARYRGPEAGTVVKDFSLKTTDGEVFKLSGNRGKIVVLDFAACTCEAYFMKIAEMDKLALDFKNKGVIFYNLFTKEVNRNKKMEKPDSSDVKQIKTQNKPNELTLEILKEYNRNRPILVDTLRSDCLQNTLGGGWWQNSLIVIDREGKVALWQEWANPEYLRKKLEDMTRK